MQLAFDFYSKTVGEILTKEELDIILKDEQAFFINYAEKYWLQRYFKMKAMVNRTYILPSITSVISDMPRGSNNQFSSKTELYGMRSVQVAEWLDHFHQSLDALPANFKKLIELKYLKRRSDGEPYEDEVIYPELNVSRGKYYQMKKAALEELGRALFGYEYLQME